MMARRRYNGGPYGAYNGTDYGFGQDFASILSLLTPNLFKAAHSTAGKIGPASVPVGRIRRTTDAATLDLYGTGPNGAVDPNVVREFNGWNLCGYSEHFGNPAWIKTGATVESNVATAPDGTTTADRITVSVQDVERCVQVIASGVSITGITYYASIWVKGEGDQIGKTVRFRTKRASGGTLVDSVVNHVLTGEWAQLTGSFTGIASNTGINIGFDGASGHATNWLAWGAQVTRDSSQPYEPRSGVGAADSVWTHRYEQAEPIGKNQIGWSNNFSDAAWTKANSTIVSSSRLTDNATNGSHRIQQSPVALAGQTETLSIEAKAGTAGFLWLFIDGVSSWFNLSTGAIGSSVGSPITPTITDVGSGWYRCAITRTRVNASTTIRVGVSLVDATENYVGSGSYIEIRNAQLETGSAATTYEDRVTHGSANRLDLIQPSSTLQPFVCRQGVPCVTANGRLTSRHIVADARRMYVNNSTAEFNELHTTGGSMVIVAKPNDTALTKGLLATRSGATGSAGINVNINSAEAVNVSVSRLIGPTTGNSVNDTETNSTTEDNILTIVIDPDNVTAEDRLFGWRNGVALTGFVNTETGTPLVENANDNLTVGSYGSGTVAFDGDISETYLAGSLISDTDRETLQDHRGEFFGLTIA